MKVKSKLIIDVKDSIEILDEYLIEYSLLLKGSSKIINTVESFEQLLELSIHRDIYFFESNKDDFKPREEKILLQGYTFEINDRDLIKELTLCIDEFIYLYDNNIYDKDKLEAIKIKIGDIKKLTIQWREDNQNRSIFLAG